MELYRYLLDHFLIKYCRNLTSRDFIVKTENLSRKKKGKREYLNNKMTRKLVKKLEILFVTTVEVPRIKVGKNQSVETLIKEESLLFAKFLRKEKTKWNPRITKIY